jgi:hypothetical protein
MTEIEGHPVHPALANFPLMDELQLEGLAASIKANGLRDPIVLDGEVLIDGRCRLIACGMAGVEPRLKQLPAGQDPVDWIFSANVLRAHEPSPARRAMRVVMIAATGNTDPPDWFFAGHRPELIEQAGAVLANYAGAVPSILSGAMSLDEVYQRVVQERRVIECRRQTMAKLQAEAPSIADLVIDEHLTLTEAFDLHRRRQEEQSNG